MGKFLDDLKNAVNEGDFNSEAAKKIIDIDKNTGNTRGLLLTDEEKEKLEKNKKTMLNVTEEDAASANLEYAKKIEIIKKQDALNGQLRMLAEIEDTIKASIAYILSFVDELKDKFSKEFEAADPLFGELLEKSKQIKDKYSSIINN